MFMGTGVALITPFKTDGTVDFDALTRLVEYQISNGTDYLVVLGTTGEPATLTAPERAEVVNHIKLVNSGKLPIMLGVGGNATAAVVAELKELDCDGISAILSVVPYYNKPSQEGIFQHYMAIAEASPLPVMLYNVPSRTGVSMLAETTIRLASSSDKFMGVKEASGDLVEVSKIVAGTADSFLVVSGEDALTLPMISVGAKGAISVASNPMPKAMSSMVSAALNGDFKTGVSLHQKQLAMFDLLFAEGNPCGAKAALAEIGVIENVLRLPLISASDELIESIAEEIQPLV